jgi:hypothetical protein
MDLAIGLDATVGPDPADPATKLLDGKEIPKFVASLDTTSLKGARFAIVPRLVGTTPDDQEGVRVFRAAVEKMKGRGATFVDLVLPALDTVVANGQVIEFEMKQDLIDYFARVPGAPVASLSQIIERGLFHLQLESTLRRRESLGNLQNPAYKAALDRRVVARDMVVQYLDDNRLDGLVYPTSNRKPEFTGFTQRGGNCTLSAVTGLPAISMPAGFTEDSLPIGIELVGRPLADARLLAFASDYERAVKPRRAPVTTPPLVDGKAPAPAEFVATTVAGGVSVRGTFTADASWRELKFDVRLNGTAADKVYGVTLDRDSSGTRQAVLYHLSGVGELAARGSLKLGTTERSELRAGRMAVRVFTKDKPDGSIRAPLTGTSQR